ncbi:MAG: phosphoglucosamine mutase, partial [Acidimicrobiia bacterium]
ELASCMQRFPQVLRNVPVDDPNGLDGAAAVWEAVERTEHDLGDRGRVLVRPSGTEPLVRVMVEAETSDDAIHHADLLAAVVRSNLGGA